LLRLALALALALALIFATVSFRFVSYRREFPEVERGGGWVFLVCLFVPADVCVND